MSAEEETVQPASTSQRDEALTPTPVLFVRVARTLTGRAGMAVVSFAFAVAVARVLGPKGRGDLALLQGLNGLAVVVANFAIAKSVVHHVGKRHLSPGAATGAASVLAIASGLAAGAVLIPIALGLRTAFLPGLPTLLIVLAVALAIPILLREYLSGVLIAVGRPMQYVAASTVQPLGGLAVIVILWGAFHSSSLQSMVGAWGFGMLMSGLAAGLFAVRFSHSPVRLHHSDVRLLSMFGVRTYPAFVALFLNLRLDQFLVRFLSSATVLGQYAVAVGVGEFLFRIPGALLISAGGALAARGREASSELSEQLCRWTILIMVAGAAVLAILTPIVVPLLFGRRFEPAVTSVLLLLPGMVCYAGAAIIAEYFILQRGAPGKVAFIAGTSLITSTVLNFPLTPALGAAGASIASSVSYFVMLSVAVVLFVRDTGRRPAGLFLVSASDIRMAIRAIRTGLLAWEA